MIQFSSFMKWFSLTSKISNSHHMKIIRAYKFNGTIYDKSSTSSPTGLLHAFLHEQAQIIDYLNFVYIIQIDIKYCFIPAPILDSQINKIHSRRMRKKWQCVTYGYSLLFLSLTGQYSDERHAAAYVGCIDVLDFSPSPADWLHRRQRRRQQKEQEQEQSK